MQLHDEQWGSGERVALLLHGMVGSTQSWWRVGPSLAALGYRVIALDLPGHGLSGANTSATVPVCADDVVESVDALAGHAPELAIGHSFGGMVLAAAASRLRPTRAIYVDAPFTMAGDADPAAARSELATQKLARTYDFLRRDRPPWSERDCEVESVAAEQFDVDTAVAVSAAPGGDWTPSAPPASLMVRAYPSRYVSDEAADRLRAGGVTVRDVPGAAHSVWYSHFDEFMALLGIGTGPAAGGSTV